MKQTLIKTTDYLNGISLKNIPAFFISCMFLGWNGIQIIFSIGLILTFIDTKSMTRMILNSISRQSNSLPIYAFALISLFVIHWFFKCITECNLSGKLQGFKLDVPNLYAVSVNFFIPNLIVVLMIFFVSGAIFIAMTFTSIALKGFDTGSGVAYEYAIYLWARVSVTASIVVTIFLIDNVLPVMIRRHSFKVALLRSIVQLKNHHWHYLLFYLFKAVLIVFSILVFQSILKYFFLPYFYMLEEKHSFSLLLFSGRTLNLSHILSNLTVLYSIIIASLLIFTPIMAFPYIYLRLLLFKWTKH